MLPSLSPFNFSRFGASLRGFSSWAAQLHSYKLARFPPQDAYPATDSLNPAVATPKKQKSPSPAPSAAVDYSHEDEAATRKRIDAQLRQAGWEVDRIEELFSRAENGQQLSEEEADELENLQNEAANYINASAEYSSFFRALLRQLGNRGWNDELLAIT